MTFCKIVIRIVNLLKKRLKKKINIYCSSSNNRCNLRSRALCCKFKASWLLSLEDERQSCKCYVAIPNAALASPASPEHHIVLGLHQGMGLAGAQNFKLNL